MNEQTTVKAYSQMSPEEQTDLINRVSIFQSQVMPRFAALGKSYSKQDVADLMEGVRLLLHWPNYRGFAQQALTATVNYHHVYNRMVYLYTLLTRTLAREMSVRTPDGQHVIVLSQQQALRRGRPTAAESEQRRREEQAEARAQALSRLTGQRISRSAEAPIAERESDTSRRKQDHEPTLFDAAISAMTDAAASESNEDGGMGDEGAADGAEAPAGQADPYYAHAVTDDQLPRLRSFRWCLPEGVATAIAALRDLYAQRADASNRAKAMFEDGASPADIQPYTQQAKAAQAQITATFREFDQALGWLYVMMSEVNPRWQKFDERCLNNGYSHVQKFMADLKGYALRCAGVRDGQMERDNQWFAATLASCQKAEAQRARREDRSPEDEKRYHKMDAYIRRTDVNPSPKRLATMRQYRDELAQMGAPAENLAAWDVFIRNCEAAITDKQ